jgi:TolA-binding protein
VGLELYDKGLYGAAQEQFQEQINHGSITNEVVVNSEYYYAMCAANLNHRDADYLLISFVENHPESNRSNVAVWALAKLFYQQRNYKKAIEWFDKMNLSALSSDEDAEYYFKLGYSCFRTNRLDSASKYFQQIIDVDTKYSVEANYYYAHIAYVAKHYDLALKSFMKIKSDPQYAKIVPQYIVQIYYLQGDYDVLIPYAISVLPLMSSQDVYEVKRILGEAYYQRKQYKEAVPFLEDYYNRGVKSPSQDVYQLGYSSYKSEYYTKAIKYLEQLTDAKDSVAQSALYIMGDCYIKLNKKQDALTAFKYASALNFDKAIQEDAMFNYAKLTYEISYQPLAIEAFEKYIAMYPNTARADECHEYLIDIYLTTNDYKAAIQAMEKVKNKNKKIMTAYQKCLYNLGIVNMNDGKVSDAVSYLDLSIKNSVDTKLEAKAIYWKAELNYKQKKYDDAMTGYAEFVFMPEAVTLDIYNLANYNLGYCYYNKQDYPNAQKWFRKYAKNKAETDDLRFNDACLRIADCYFFAKDYVGALEYYNKGIDNNSKASDYALYQKGMILGIRGKLPAKREALQRLLNEYKSSPYYDDAMFQIANSHLVSGESEEAMKMYKTIVADYPNSNYIKQSLLGIALIYYNNKDNDKALLSYKQVIADYPSTSEAREALSGIKSIYMDQSNIKEYLTYAEKLPFANISRSTQDSLLYQSAELRYMKGDCDGAVGDFMNYIKDFPQGYYVLNANYYKAECDYTAKRFDDALVGYNFVSAQPKNGFSETSLLKASRIYFDEKKCDSALIKYIKLEEFADTKQNQVEAQTGQMRCYFQSGNNLKAIDNAQKVMSNEKSSNELISEAHLIAGKSYMNLDSMNNAIKEFNAVIIITESEMSAEARYNIAAIHFQKKDYKKSSDVLFELIKMVPSYDYWIAKGFILLGDDYMMMDDAFQAKHTWQSIIENYEGADLKAIAQKKLDDLKKKEEDQLPKEKKVEPEKDDQDK